MRGKKLREREREVREWEESGKRVREKREKGEREREGKMVISVESQLKNVIKSLINYLFLFSTFHSSDYLQ